MTADCRDNLKTIQEAKCSWQYPGQEFSLAPIEGKIQLFESYYYPIFGCAL